tara:strand:- start:411 stop:1088 length:678 start_codon:yes stop_codon:yes gene_type:complete
MSLDLKTLSQPDAHLIQVALKQTGHYSGTTRGLPGPKTLAAYARFLLDSDAQPELPYIHDGKYDRIAFIERFVAIAKSQVGVVEVGGNNRGKRIDEYEKATWLDPEDDNPWCASFICWCIREALKGIIVPFKRPRTPAAFRFEDWAESQPGLRVIKSDSFPRFGDIVIFKFSHIAVCTSRKPSRNFTTVEGNTGSVGERDGDGVWQKLRSYDGKYGVRSIVRFTQ